MYQERVLWPPPGYCDRNTTVKADGGSVRFLITAPGPSLVLSFGHIKTISKVHNSPKVDTTLTYPQKEKKDGREDQWITHRAARLLTRT